MPASGGQFNMGRAALTTTTVLTVHFLSKALGLLVIWPPKCRQREIKRKARG